MARVIDMDEPRSQDRPREKRSISLFLTLALGFSVSVGLSCIAVGALTYYLQSDEIRSQAYDRLEGLRDEKITALNRWYMERIGDLSVMTRRFDLKEICADVHGRKPMDEDRGLELLEDVRDAYRYHAAFIADSEGEEILLTTEVGGVVLEDLPIRKATLQRSVLERRAAVSDVIVSKVHRKHTILFAAPVLESDEGRVLCTVGILEDPVVDLYPQFTKSEYLGATGEILLINRERIVQSPLKYRAGAVSLDVIDAAPARRGAAGATGRIASDDYRPKPVMAAYGHSPSIGWGLVVKQDLTEIDIPVRELARNLLLISTLVLVLAIILGLVVARRISEPAARISKSAAAVGAGAMDVRAPIVGPREIRGIATEINRMMDALSRGVHISDTLAEIYAIAGQYTQLEELLGAVLPMLMSATRSQLASVYLDREDGDLVRVYARSVPDASLPQKIRLDPPDHLLGEAAASGRIQLHSNLPSDSGLVLSTNAGDAPARSLIGIPLLVVGRVRGVVGLASLYDYRTEDIEIVETLALNLGLSIEAVIAAERTEALAIEVSGKNQDLTLANEELQVKSEELQNQADELREVAYELEVQRKEVEEADRLKSEFLTNMSHELRTPLNSVLALSQLMLEHGTGKDSEKDSEYLRVIERSGRHLLNLINDILDLAKVESGKLDIEICQFRLADVIGSALETISPLAAEKGLDLVAEDLTDALVSTDEKRVQQILLNLLSNALKFTEEGEVRIEARVLEGLLRIQVIDTGIGIPEEELPHIFEEFRQVDGTLARRHEGTGLGLAICRRLAKIMGGVLEAESVMGQGSTFTLELPLRPAAVGEGAGIPENGRSSRDHEVPREPSSPSGSRSVLVVEDNEIASLHLRSALTQHGWTVRNAANGREGLERLAESMPQVLVLDLMMPEVDGFELLGKLRSVPGASRVPVLVVTSKDLTLEERQRLAAHNVSHLIQKGSVNRVQLISTVERLAQIARARAKGNRVTPDSGIDSTGPILVVEEHPDNRVTMHALLADAGREVVIVQDAAERIALAREARPSLVLLDIQLPGMCGVEAVRQMKTSEDLAKVPVVAVTARAMKGDREELLEAGFDDYLPKPVEPEALAVVLDKWLGGDR